MALLSEWYGIAGFLVGMVVVFMLLGIPVAFAFLTANIVGAMIYMGGLDAMPQIVVNAVESVTIFALIPVPLFIIMGELFFHTGLAIRVFDALDLCFGRLPGRLSYITVVGGTIFATLSGSTMANTAMMGSMMVPEMTSRGYKKHMSMGPILGTGGLAMIIPPSALAVLLASLAEIDIGKLLIAGVLPGLVLAVLYSILIYAQVKIDKDAAPEYVVESTSFGPSPARPAAQRRADGLRGVLRDRADHPGHRDADRVGRVRRAGRAHPRRDLPGAVLGTWWSSLSRARSGSPRWCC